MTTTATGKLSRQEARVIEILAGHVQYGFTAEELAQRLSAVSTQAELVEGIKTVKVSLCGLVAAGLLSRDDGDGKVRYVPALAGIRLRLAEVQLRLETIDVQRERALDERDELKAAGCKLAYEELEPLERRLLGAARGLGGWMKAEAAEAG